MGRKLFFFNSIAIFIITILVIIIFPKYLCDASKNLCEQYENTRDTIKDITIALRRFQSDKGYFPRELSLLTKSVEETKIKYIEKIQTDQWANPFIYVVQENEKEFLLYSIGINSQNEFGKGDDIFLETDYNKSIYCD